MWQECSRNACAAVHTMHSAHYGKPSNKTTFCATQAQAKSGSRSKQADKGKAAASAPVTPVKKGRAAAKRAAEPTSERQPASKKAAKGQADIPTDRDETLLTAEPVTGAVPPTPAKGPQTPAKPPQEAAAKRATGMSAFMQTV